ncbi:MAG: hypothetical protein HRU15_10730, partial [Planctomycetes bacterium]|nr:hypothetical protein [Planctomycetota bacterium]
KNKNQYDYIRLPLALGTADKKMLRKYSSLAKKRKYKSVKLQPYMKEMPKLVKDFPQVPEVEAYLAKTNDLKTPCKQFDIFDPISIVYTSAERNSRGRWYNPYAITPLCLLDGEQIESWAIDNKVGDTQRMYHSGDAVGMAWIHLGHGHYTFLNREAGAHNLKLVVSRRWGIEAAAAGFYVFPDLPYEITASEESAAAMALLTKSKAINYFREYYIARRAGEQSDKIKYYDELFECMRDASLPSLNTAVARRFLSMLWQCSQHGPDAADAWRLDFRPFNEEDVLRLIDIMAQFPCDFLVQEIAKRKKETQDNAAEHTSQRFKVTAEYYIWLEQELQKAIKKHGTKVDLFGNKLGK